MRRKQIVSITSLIVTIVSLVSSFILYTNYDELLAQLGVENKIIQLADSSRLSNDYSKAIKNYEKILTKGGNLSPYANLALAEIYSTELENKDYDIAIKYYKKAMSESADIRILESALNLLLRELVSNDKNTVGSQSLDFENNLSFFTTCINKYQKIYPDKFDIYNLDFPITENTFDEVFIHNKELEYTIVTYKWVYDYTKISENSGLAYIADDDKLVYITSFSEAVCPSVPSSFATVTRYKYYHYNKEVLKKTKKTQPSLERLKMIIPPSNKILLTELKSEFQTMSYES